MNQTRGTTAVLSCSPDTWSCTVNRERGFALFHNFKHVYSPRAWAIQPLGTSSGSILKLLFFPSFCTSSRKIPFASLFYIIFCFISYMYIIIGQGQGETILGDNFFWWRQKGLITLITGCTFQKNIFALCFYAHIFMILYMYIVLAGADNPLGPKFWCQQEGLISLVICCKFQ